jgi:hypothetical protein
MVELRRPGWPVWDRRRIRGGYRVLFVVEGQRATDQGHIIANPVG